jgi:hypothetical protein
MYFLNENFSLNVLLDIYYTIFFCNDNSFAEVTIIRVEPHHSLSVFTYVDFLNLFSVRPF